MVLFPGYIGGERVEIGILEAAASGNVSIIRRWLEDGGDANEEITAPAAFSLLVFAPTFRPRTRAAWRRAPPGLPDPLAHLVCQFWLGEPPRRANRHAADTPSPSE